MTEVLATYGFTYSGRCHCGGKATRKYKKDKYLLYLRHTDFRLKENGVTVKGYTDINGLEKYLSEKIRTVQN